METLNQILVILVVFGTIFGIVFLVFAFPTWLICLSLGLSFEWSFTFALMMIIAMLRSNIDYNKLAETINELSEISTPKKKKGK